MATLLQRDTSTYIISKKWTFLFATLNLVNFCSLVTNSDPIAYSCTRDFFKFYHSELD